MPQYPVSGWQPGMTDGYTSVRPLYGLWRPFGAKTYIGARKRQETQQRVVFVASDGIWRKRRGNRRTEVTRKECLDHAAKAVLIDRNAAYGDTSPCVARSTAFAPL